MAMEQAVIVAGIGCRKGCDAADIVAVVDAALSSHGLGRAALSAIAVPAGRAAMPAVGEAARRLGLPLLTPDRAALDNVTSRLLTYSIHSMRATGLGSACEAAALAAAGDGSRLLGPRLVEGPATCAIAIGDGR